MRILVEGHISKCYDEADRRWSSINAAAGRATQLLASHPAQCFGMLSAAPRLHWDNACHHVQVRSEPSNELAGAELRFRDTAGEPGRRFETSLMAGLINWAKDLWEARELAAELVTALRTRLRSGGGPDAAPGRYPVVTAIGVAPSFASSNPFELVADLKVLGSGTGWTTDRVLGHSLEEVSSKVMDRTNEHLRSLAVLGQLRADRVRSWIEDTAAQALDAAGLPLEEGLHRLLDRSELVFDLDDGKYRCALRWVDGLLRCDVCTNGSGWSLRGDVLWLSGRRLPDVVFVSLLGRRLSALIEHPLLPRDAVITHAQRRPNHELAIWLAIPRKSLPDPQDTLGQIIQGRYLGGPSG